MNADEKDKNRSEFETTGHRQIEEDLPGFALGCLDREASDCVSDHLLSCESCRTLLSTYEETVGLLAFGIPMIDPPESLIERLMNRIDNQPSIQKAQQPKTTRPFTALFRWFSPALAMACLLVIVSLATVNLLQWRQSRTIAHQLAAPLKIVRMQGTPFAPHADGTFVIGQNPLHGVLVASDLPPISSNQQLQLWFVRNGAKDSGGTLSMTPLGYVVMQISSSRPLSDYQSAIVTVEPLGGSLAPTGPQLMSAAF